MNSPLTSFNEDKENSFETPTKKLTWDSEDLSQLRERIKAKRRKIEEQMRYVQSFYKIIYFYTAALEK